MVDTQCRLQLLLCCLSARETLREDTSSSVFLWKNCSKLMDKEPSQHSILAAGWEWHRAR
jgi:hypothetical protein